MTERNNLGLRVNEARLNITWNGQNGDLPDPVPYDASEMELKTWAWEAVRGGSVPGIKLDPGVDFADFVVDRFPASAEVPYNRVFIRPKTPFGARP